MWGGCMEEDTHTAQMRHQQEQRLLNRSHIQRGQRVEYREIPAHPLGGVLETSMHATNPAMKAATCPKFCLEAIAICMSLVSLTMIGLCLTELPPSPEAKASVSRFIENRETQVWHIGGPRSCEGRQRNLLND